MHDDMIHRNTGLLNLQYFNVKKGSYWAPHLTERLKEMVVKYGAYHSQYCVYSVIKRHKFKRETSTATEEALKAAKGDPDYVRLFKGFETIEIKLRICRLLRVCDLTGYQGRKFNSIQDVDNEASENWALYKKGMFG